MLQEKSVIWTSRNGISPHQKSLTEPTRGMLMPHLKSTLQMIRKTTTLYHPNAQLTCPHNLYHLLR